MTGFRDLPTVPRLAAAATVVYGMAMLLFGGLLLWIAATTGEPVILNPHRFGEAELEAVLLAVIMGVACYGMATLDWLLRRPSQASREGDPDAARSGQSADTGDARTGPETGPASDRRPGPVHGRSDLNGHRAEDGRDLTNRTIGSAQSDPTVEADGGSTDDDSPTGSDTHDEGVE